MKMEIDMNEECNNRISYERNIRTRPMRKLTYILSHQKENFYKNIQKRDIEKASKCFLRIKTTQLSILDKIMFEEDNTKSHPHTLLVVNNEGNKRIEGDSEIIRQIGKIFMNNHISMSNLLVNISD
jgi:hypothetical protein